MKRIILTIMVLGILSFLVTPVLAGGAVHAHIVRVNGYHYGGYHYGYHGGWNGYRAYYPPVYVYNLEGRMFPNHPAIPPLPIVAPYYYYPGSSFYYSSLVFP